MVVTLAFKKDTSPLFSRDWILSKIIEIKTMSQFSHVEIIIKDKWIASGDPEGTGVTINDLRPITNDGKWLYLEVEVNEEKFERVMDFIKSQVGTGYDWFGAILGGGFDVDIDEKDKWFCSELVTEILIRFDVPEVQGIIPATVSPGDLYKLFTDYYFVI